jgi:hypothetical protein
MCDPEDREGVVYAIFCKLAPVCWLLFAVSMPVLAQTGNDWRIVPGERVGPVTAATTRADLPRLFPGAPAKDDEIELAEGVLEPATQIADLAIIWSAKDPGAHPARLFICRGGKRASCQWQTADGITLGVRLDRLEQLNGRPFSIAGFGFDYGGNVLSWNGGKLARLDCGPRLILTLDGDRGRDGRLTVDLTSEERHSITGDKTVASDTPAMRKVNPAVTELVFQFADTQPCASR